MNKLLIIIGTLITMGLGACSSTHLATVTHATPKDKKDPKKQGTTQNGGKKSVKKDGSIGDPTAKLSPEERQRQRREWLDCMWELYAVKRAAGDVAEATKIIEEIYRGAQNPQSSNPIGPTGR